MTRSLFALFCVALVAASCTSDDPGVAVDRADLPSETVADTDASADPTSPDATLGSESSVPSGSETSASDPVTTERADDPVTAVDGLDWAPCRESNPLASFECATLTVPLDHSDPTGEQIEIAVARTRSADAGSRIGSLVFNPGGPGGSGIDFLTQAVAVVPPEVQQRFDLVGFDPRGVGESTAVECDVPIDDNISLVPEGDDAAYEELVVSTAAELERCTDETFAIAPYLGTDNAARDLDLLRAALGDDGLSYVGYSYGTRLGATYAELFPGNVRALVLDAAVKPTTDPQELDLGQAEGFDRALENFAAACDADADCLLREIGPTLDVIAGLRTEIAEVGEFPTDDPTRVLTPGELELGIIAALYSKQAWPFLAEALYLAEVDQDGTLLQVLGDGLVGRRPDGSYDNSNVANTFINCADDASRPDVAEIRRDAEEAAALSEFFDAALRATTGCLGVPESADPLTVGPASGAPPLLVIGNTGDPATPYEWSVELADFLDSGVLYTVEAEGHTAYGTIECVAPVVNAYLIDLEVPAEGSSCSDNEDADFFVPAGASQVDLVVALFDCLRENGAEVPEITTADVLADTDGSVLGESLDPTDPTILVAIQQCTDILADIQGG